MGGFTESYGQSVANSTSLMNCVATPTPIPSLLDMLLTPLNFPLENCFFYPNEDVKNAGVNFEIYVATPHNKLLLLNKISNEGSFYDFAPSNAMADIVFANMRSYLKQFITDDITIVSVDSSHENILKKDGDLLLGAQTGGYDVGKAIPNLLFAYGKCFKLLIKQKKVRDAYYQILAESLVDLLRAKRIAYIIAHLNSPLVSSKLTLITKICMSLLQTDNERVIFVQLMMHVLIARNSSVDLNNAITLVMALPDEIIKEALLTQDKIVRSSEVLFKKIIRNIKVSSAPSLTQIISKLLKSTKINVLADWMYGEPDIYECVYMTGRMLSYMKNLQAIDTDLLRTLITVYYVQFDAQAKRIYQEQHGNKIAEAISMLGKGLNSNEPLPPCFFNEAFFGDRLYKKLKRYAVLKSLEHNNIAAIESIREQGLFNLSSPKLHRGIEFHYATPKNRAIWDVINIWAIEDHSDLSGEINFKKLAKTICHGHQSYHFLLKELFLIGKITELDLIKHITTRQGYETVRLAFGTPALLILTQSQSKNVKVLALKDSMK